ncbi:hypothetical protein [Nocardiopsis alborubida]|uniref:Uncharacterized protein n=1 Tax=Nocardiopsis alborubida TaxID=146802 RepID=A0A7X6MDU6_9ACTN|nr:hypothetical protein [Nocardiopsis alborubida]NKY98942.1 hypothetical protein [Nocardiopsis alborubida]
MAKQPRTHYRWDLLGKEEDPVPWSAYDARSLKTFYEGLADSAEQAAADLRRLDKGQLGEGSTVDALKELIEELPKYLDKAHSAYEKGYKALDTWTGALETAREQSGIIVFEAEQAYLALEDPDAWKEEADGDDPVRDAYVTRLQTVLGDMDDAVGTCKNALEEAKQGDPNELWGWLDAIVTWVEENPLIYAAILVVGGIAAIFIPGLGIALALGALAISASTLHREGKLGFNMETVTTLGLDLISLVPGGVLLRGGRAVTRGLTAAAPRVTGSISSGVRGASSAVRGATSGVRGAVGGNRAVRTVTSTVSRVSRDHPIISTTITTGARDTAVGMGSSIAVQMAAGTSWEDIDLGYELASAAATNVPGAAVGAARDHGSLPSFLGGSDGSGGGSGPTPGADPAPAVGDGASPDPAATPSAPDTPDAGGGPAAPDTGGDPATSGTGGTLSTPEPAAAPSTPEPAATPSASDTGGIPSAPDTGGAPATADTGGTPGATAPSSSPSPSGDGQDASPQGGTAPSGTGDGPGAPDIPTFSGEATPSSGAANTSTEGVSLPGRPSADAGDVQVDVGGGPDTTGSGPAHGAPEPTAHSADGASDPSGAADTTGGGPVPEGQRFEGEYGGSTGGANVAGEGVRLPSQRPGQPGEPVPDAPAPRGEGADTAGRPDTGPSAAPDGAGGDGAHAGTGEGSGAADQRTVTSGDFGEYRTSRGPDGEQSVSYRYPADGGDYTMNVTRDGVDVGGTSVRRAEDGFQVTGADGSSVTTSRGPSGGVDLTGPDGTPGASYRDGEVRVPTADGEVTVSRDGDGSTIRTGDGLTVQQPRGDGDVRITRSGDGPVDLRFGGGGPEISRPADDGSSAVPRTRVTDPATGRSTEIGSDGYRIDSEGGTSQSYDRGTDSATVDSGDTRVRADQHGVRVTDGARGVDLWQSRDGVGTATGADSSAVVRSDGSAEIRTNNPSLTPRAVQDANGDVTVGDTRTAPGRVRTEDGAAVGITERDGRTVVEVRGTDGATRSYGTDGRPHGPYPPLRTDPATGQPCVLTGGTRVTLVPGTDPALRVDTPQGWTVTTSRDGQSSVSTPPDARGDRLQTVRDPDGSTAMRAGDHWVVSGPERPGGPERVVAGGPDGVHARSSADGAHVGDGTTRTEARPGDSSGLGRGETTRTVPPYGPVAEHTGTEGRVTTDGGVTVRTRADEVRLDVPRDADRTVRDGDRVIGVGPRGTDVRGPSPDSPGNPPLRMGETAGDAGRVPPRWHVSAGSDGSMTGHTRPDHGVSVRPEPGRLPNPFRGSDEVSFRAGEVGGTQTPSGRTTVTDGDGNTIRDGRGGVRVDGGEGRPDLRITPDHVRVTTPEGAQHRVDVPGARTDGDGTSAPRSDDAAPGTRTDGDGAPAHADGGTGAPGDRRDGDTTGSDGEGTPARQRDGESSGGDSPGGDRPPVRPSLNSFGAMLEEMRLTLTKNFVNVLGGLGVEIGWQVFADGDFTGTDIVQAVVQLGTAAPKGLAEGQLSGTTALPTDGVRSHLSAFPLEMGHQAIRNDLRDLITNEYLDEEVAIAAEREAIGGQTAFLEGELIPELEKEIKAARADGNRPEDLRRLEAVLAAAEAQQASLEKKDAELDERVNLL